MPVQPPHTGGMGTDQFVSLVPKSSKGNILRGYT